MTLDIAPQHVSGGPALRWVLLRGNTFALSTPWREVRPLGLVVIYAVADGTDVVVVAGPGIRGAVVAGHGGRVAVADPCARAALVADHAGGVVVAVLSQRVAAVAERGRRVAAAVPGDGGGAGADCNGGVVVAGGRPIGADHRPNPGLCLG